MRTSLGCQTDDGCALIECHRECITCRCQVDRDLERIGGDDRCIVRPTPLQGPRPLANVDATVPEEPLDTRMPEDDVSRKGSDFCGATLTLGHHHWAVIIDRKSCVDDVATHRTRPLHGQHYRLA